jgi:hypothetical protein
MEDKRFDYSEHTDYELVSAWNYLESCVLDSYVEYKMWAISGECRKRKIISWNDLGEIKYDV